MRRAGLSSIAGLSCFTGRSHCTKFYGSTYEQLDISASIIQGSAVGPASYVTNAANLFTVTDGNLTFKYADDTYIVIPAANVSSRCAELDNVDRWAESNNLRLNRAKSVEIIFTGCKRKPTGSLPLQIPGIRRVTSIKMLSITMSNHLSFGKHVREVMASVCSLSMFYVYKAVVLSKLLYASPAWWGFTCVADRQRLEASIRRAVRSGFYASDEP